MVYHSGDRFSRQPHQWLPHPHRRHPSADAEVSRGHGHAGVADQAADEERGGQGYQLHDGVSRTDITVFSGNQDKKVLKRSTIYL